MKTVFIYALCEPGTRTVRYIGKTSRLSERLKAHLKTRAQTHLGHWIRSLSSPPTVVVLREIPENRGSEAEIRYIRLARGCGIRLTNSTDGGEGLLNPSAETRQKMREKQLGSVHTEEHRHKCGSSNRGKMLTKSHKKAIGDANRGRASLNKGRHPSKETRAKMSAARKGILFSEAHRASLSAARVAYLNRVQSIEWALAPYTLD